MVNKIYAFIKKDFLIEASYKLAFIAGIFNTAVGLLIYYFIDKLFGNTITPHLREFGVNYFSYVLLSMAFFNYIGTGLGSFSSRISFEQTQGTLESLLLTPTDSSVILASIGLWNLIFATIDMLIYIALGIFLFHIQFSDINIVSVSVVLILTIVTFSSLGILSASFIIVFKKGNPLGWVFNTLTGLLGGVYFPISVMPVLLQAVAQCFPVTYAIRAMQLAVYRGYSLGQLKTECLVLLLFSVLLVPLSLSAFNYALTKARRNGSLLQY